MTTWEMAFWKPPPGASVSSGVISVTSPSYTSLFSFMRRPTANSIELKISLSLSDDEMLDSAWAVGVINAATRQLPDSAESGPRTAMACQVRISGNRDHVQAVSMLHICKSREGSSAAVWSAPMALRKCSMRTSVFLTSDEYTSDPTIGQNGTCSTPKKRQLKISD